MMNKNSTTRHREKNAQKGDVSAKFQLYKSYLESLDVDINNTNAQRYLDECRLFLEARSNDEHPDNVFILDTLKLIDFRKFKQLTLKLDKHLTVLIGDNGAGKTTIIEGIAKTLSYITNGIVKEGANGEPMNYDDINNNSTHYAEINTTFSFGSVSSFNSFLAKAPKGAKDKKDSEVAELKLLADIWRVVNANHEINLPTFAYYSVERSNNTPKKSHSSEKRVNFKRHSRFDAYQDALKGAGRFDHFVEWFIALHKQAQGNKSEKIVDLKEQITELRKIVFDENHPLWSLLQQTEAEYLAAQKQNIDNDAGSSYTYLKTISDAITHVVPEINDINVETSSGYDEVLVEINKDKLKLSQLSAGQKVFIALIADLARRLILLNPKLAHPLTGQGIVLIDEIELHLHPLWQQKVLISLQETFPNIQFIITTHSPQVLSTVDKKCIRLLTDNKNGDTYISTPEFQTKGVISSDVLEQIMQTKSIPDVPEASWLTDMLGFIEENNHTKPEAIELYAKLKEHFGENHFEILRCESQVRLQEMKARVRAKMK